MAIICLKSQMMLLLLLPCGLLTIEEAEKFTEFLKHQQWLIDEAKRKKEDEEWKKTRGF